MPDSVNFFSEDIEFELNDPDLVRLWISQIVRKYKFKIKQVDFIFGSDDYVLKLNRDYLKHDYFTDIITFPYHGEGDRELFSDIYISIDRVKENAQSLDCSFIDELHRVIIHGILHMVGFSDKDEKSKGQMRHAEDLALSLRMF